MAKEALDLDRALDTARRAVEAAAKAALPHYHRGVTVDWKEDKSPVTAADKESEAAILAVIHEAFPTHSILAEESGVDDRGSTTRWIVDPLDGTRGFSRGGSFWGPLVALEDEGQIVAGAMGMPVLGDYYWAAKGRGAWKNGERIKLSTITDWSQATMSVGELHLLMGRDDWAKALTELIKTSASARGYGDPAGAALVLSGRAEAWVEAGVKTWDIAPMKILFEEAGGIFTAFDGTLSIETGTAIGATPAMHAHVLAVLKKHRA
ncbi:inositol monophosphatase [Myxococcota bacterium]|nr:inositol monophosphatase [Myxococcota bacterium]